MFLNSILTNLEVLYYLKKTEIDELEEHDENEKQLNYRKKENGAVSKKKCEIKPRTWINLILKLNLKRNCEKFRRIQNY